VKGRSVSHATQRSFVRTTATTSEESL
jgi:hypothetical protein